LFMIRYLHPDLDTVYYTKYFTQHNIRRVCATLINRVNQQFMNSFVE